jgi:hypothetical protein
MVLKFGICVACVFETHSFNLNHFVLQFIPIRLF